MNTANEPVEKMAEFAESYLKLNTENQNYVLGVLQTLMFAQNTMKVGTQKVGITASRLRP